MNFNIGKKDTRKSNRKLNKKIYKKKPIPSIEETTPSFFTLDSLQANPFVLNDRPWQENASGSRIDHHGIVQSFDQDEYSFSSYGDVYRPLFHDTSEYPTYDELTEDENERSMRNIDYVQQDIPLETLVEEDWINLPDDIREQFKDFDDFREYVLISEEYDTWLDDIIDKQLNEMYEEQEMLENELRDDPRYYEMFGDVNQEFEGDYEE